MNLPERLVRRIEALEAIDSAAKPLQAVVARLVGPRVVRNTLSGTNVGHPLHPMLTDVPIGAWLASAVLDTLGGSSAGPAADLLVGAGIVAAVPTAMSGLNDWSDTQGAEARLGAVHAVGNVAALGLFAGSLVARLSGRRGAGRVLSAAGLTATMGGAYLGGHLSFARGVNVNRTAFENRPAEWTPVAADSDVPEGATLEVGSADAPVLVHRQQGRLYALADTCSHLGGPLHEGTISDGCVTCPWHGSIFRLEDGAVVRGPASSPQPRYETRVVDGRIEVRSAS